MEETNERLVEEGMKCRMMTLEMQKATLVNIFPNLQKATIGPETPTKQSHNTAGKVR